MPLEVLRRNDWDDTPRELGYLFVLRKGSNRRVARWALTTHILGWECRLLVGSELLQSQVYRSQEEVFSTGENWKAARVEKG
jgi:hypothetical protein